MGMANLDTARNCRIIPPLSTASEAKELMNEYIEQISQDSQGKVQFASSEVTDLVFVPAEMTPSYVSFHDTLDLNPPRMVGDIRSTSSVAV
jgi:hypothetical protein